MVTHFEIVYVILKYQKSYQDLYIEVKKQPQIFKEVDVKKRYFYMYTYMSNCLYCQGMSNQTFFQLNFSISCYHGKQK